MLSKKQVQKTPERAALIRSARDEMAKWKAETGIRAVVPRSDNQKVADKRYRRRKAREEANGTFGAASAVRRITVDEGK